MWREKKKGRQRPTFSETDFRETLDGYKIDYEGEKKTKEKKLQLLPFLCFSSPFYFLLYTCFERVLLDSLHISRYSLRYASLTELRTFEEGSLVGVTFV